MIKRLAVVVVILAGVLLLGCVQEEELKLTEVEELKNCQCHELAYKYPKHLNGTEYCLDCHAVDKHPEVDREVTPENCSDCHETSLFRIHMPRHSCTVCHGDAGTIHEKFEKKFVEGTE